MITVTLNKDWADVNNYGKVDTVVHTELNDILYNLRLGTSVKIKSDNPKVEPHRGEYFLLLVEEFEEIYIMYKDLSNKVRIVYQGYLPETGRALYRNVADDMVVKVLKSNNKKAYRVVEEVNGEERVVEFTYKNKDSEVVKQVYLTILDCIKVAANRQYKNGGKYKVITPKGTVLFEIG